MNQPKPLCRADALGIHLSELAAHYRISQRTYADMLANVPPGGGHREERKRLEGILSALKANETEATRLSDLLLLSPTCAVVLTAPERPTCPNGNIALHEVLTLKDGVTVWVPCLDHDVRMVAQFGHSVHARGRVERRLIAALVQHLDRAGFDVVALWDGEERTEFDLAKDVVAKTKDVMELVFNLDECSLRVLKKGVEWIESREDAEGNRNAYREPEHGILVVLGNSGWDSISDWNWSQGDEDGFGKAMEAFDVERFA